jgi:hypothetical protein
MIQSKNDTSFDIKKMGLDQITYHTQR